MTRKLERGIHSAAVLHGRNEFRTPLRPIQLTRNPHEDPTDPTGSNRPRLAQDSDERVTLIPWAKAPKDAPLFFSATVEVNARGWKLEEGRR